MPRCRECKEKFESKYFLQKYCMIKDECIKAFRLAIKPGDVAKVERKETQKQKVELLTHSDWIQILQKVFNTFIRLRDKDLPCVSCGTTKDVKYDAGHFWPTTYSFLRFNEDNVHKQCSNDCNKHKSGNVGEYRINLVRRIGQERVNCLDDNRYNELRITIPEIQARIYYYKQQIKDLKK